METDDEPITAYWVRHYATDFCTLCGNCGVIDTRGVRAPAGHEVGRLNYCICPNGQWLRRHGGSMGAHLAAATVRHVEETTKPREQK